ncbi:glycerol-3-phosphate dehydrogenase, mitochondrial-like [Acanthaster planci]|uniref:Glycerol-3-phosphate dehydrogenase n=1 Tax=Acanthaster planci TaxID=133434 RepID=A0A8B8A1M0_ACAPL|nr:glycerol-3-phosphate dehydrogenase, mitochondrial-like [Acanthaster planci]XP_022111579.1 glycerol-3-phosphate dehydrogenase, mitochondrial-like [Acanthaster planci]XP_022111582.1 glycerol-3-phosphate dehydrogenase, mitochondrial-like [Acanthaster planci]XP_022111584.1 glycerol-3-phosphate dehydrogenase, mitochondrial-like [Acanthaster planci]XP_022111591.1 glycerol-3-phosphate dehydrogenase, mitochondrial-like [Acanthaster planci]XP_022111596.1 glycerol-3-phosphate dehydrogenase, mitochond
MASSGRLRKVVIGGGLLGAGALLAGYVVSRNSAQKLSKNRQAHVVAAELRNAHLSMPLPTREQQMQSLQNTHEFDVLVIGGGATGCGVALDAVSRGLKTALVEMYDFSAGTSSRSTKLIHGGVRYLEKAIKGLDLEQYRLVKEALHERANLLEIAPHLSSPLPIMLPVYKWWQLPYFWAGIKMYDLVAGRQCLKPSYLLSKTRALELFPMLKKEKLVGGIVYYDGQHNDARMNIAIALTAARMGATVANHTEVLSVIKGKDASGQEVIKGALVRDKMTGKEYSVLAKSVINATGPFTDSVRKMAEPEATTICAPSSGIHIVLPGYYSPEAMGLLDPATSDGRVIFFLPWQNFTIAGTTDNPCKVTHNPGPTEDEIQFILNEVKDYLSPEVAVRRGDVLAAWSGIRPLVRDPKAKNTESIARNHVIDVSSNKMVTIAGGKWTTYRSMAKDAVDAAIKACNLQPKNDSLTDGLVLEGGHGWTPNMFIRLIQDFGLDDEVARHLSETYGDKAVEVARMANLTGKRWPVVGKKLAQHFPYLEAEVAYAVKEYACTAIDVLARRTRLAFLNVMAAEEALPRIIDIMAKELGWSSARQKLELEKATRFLNVEMGYNCHSSLLKVPIQFSNEEIAKYTKRFHLLDKDSKGYITPIDMRNFLSSVGETITEDQLRDMLQEVDCNKNGRVELDEFLQLMSAIKTGAMANVRLEIALNMGARKVISTDRSGGGV